MPPKKSAATASTKDAKADTTKKSAAPATRGRSTRTKAADTATDDTAAKKAKATAAPAKSRQTKAAATAPAPAADSKKRKAEDETAREQKKARVAKPKPAPKAKPKVVINSAPTTKLNVYVCGEGSSGELGLGTARNAVDVKRPRLNPHLLADQVGVVQVAVGGMHCVALTHDNKILTWGVNDQGALGRDTNWDGGYKNVDENNDDSDSDDNSDSGLNPREATPAAIPSSAFPDGTVFAEVAAGDSASFAVTDEGYVYGWGTFRSNDGILGFDAKTKVQTTPTLIPGLKKIKHLACGANHVLALNEKGGVFAWGSGQQNQLGRRIVERNKLNGLDPREFGMLKKIKLVACGSYHSFAVHESGKVYAWGLNNFGETGIKEGAGESNAAIVQPTVVESLSSKNLIQLSGGAHHSIAATEDGKCLVWGRLDGFQTGLKVDSLPDEDVIKDERGRPRILIEPTAVPNIKAQYVAAASDHCIAIDKDGRAWSWGFSATYQTGQGTQDDIEVATVIDNTAVRGKKLNWAGAGGQFSVLTEPVY